MKTLFTTLVTLFSFLSLHTIDNNDYDRDEEMYYSIYHLALRRVNTHRHIKHKKQVAIGYANRIIEFSKKYDLPPERVAMQIDGESRFNYRAKGDKYDGVYNSFGCAQIMLKYHVGKMYKLDNGNLGKHFKRLESQGKKIDYRKYLFRIVYNIELQCMLMREFLDRYGDYELALLAYGTGPNSKSFKKFKNYKRKPLKYIRYIMDGVPADL
jgi:soluble lytic murein transglycosylase-like protein